MSTESEQLAHASTDDLKSRHWKWCLTREIFCLQQSPCNLIEFSHRALSSAVVAVS